MEENLEDPKTITKVSDLHINTWPNNCAAEGDNRLMREYPTCRMTDTNVC